MTDDNVTEPEWYYWTCEKCGHRIKSASGEPRVMPVLCEDCQKEEAADD